jgi:PAS domain S-box-containing protein
VTETDPTRSLLVVGEDGPVADALEAESAVADRAAVVGAGAVVDGGRAAGSVDDHAVALVDHDVEDVAAVVEHLPGASDRPVVVTSDGSEDAGDVLAALAAGANATVPRQAVERDPSTALARLAALGEADDGTDADPRDEPPERAVESAPSRARATVDRAMADTDTPTSFHDPETGTTLLGSRGLADALGVEDRSTLRGLALDDLVEADHREAFGERLAEVAADLELRTMELAVETGGQRRWFRVTFTPATLGERRCVSCVWNDVTERRELRRTYRAVFESVSDGLVVHDPETGEITDANERFCEMLGYDREALVGESVDTVTAPGYGYEEVRERIRQAREHPQLFEWRARRADGDGFPVEVHLSLGEIRGQERVLASVRDVTERHRRRRQLELIVDRIDEGIYLAPADDGYNYLSPAYGDLTGLDPDRLREEESLFVERVHPEDREQYREFVSQTAADLAAGDTEDRYDLEFRFDHPDRGTRWFHATGYPVEGDTYEFVSVLADVTERVQREREYEQIFDAVNDSIVVHDPETGEMVDANESFCELLGYDRETVLELGTAGVSVTEAGYTEERAKAVIEEVVAEDTTAHLEWVVETADGEHRTLEVTGTTAPVGGQRRYVSLIRDVTERVQREREYEQIFDAVSDAIAVFDPETLGFVDVNERFETLLGYADLDRIREVGIEGLSATEEGYTAERARELLSTVAETGDRETVEWQCVTADGGRRWLEVTLARGEVGGQTRVLALLRDVTERRRREREYEQIFDGVNDAIAVFDPDTAEIVDVNEPYRELLGYDLDRIRELGIEGLSATDEGFTGERGQKLLREVAETGDSRTVEWRAETADGGRRWLEVTLARGEVGGQTRVLSIQRDVTERRRRQREYEQIFDGVNDAIAVFDPESLAFVEVNESYRELLGYDFEQIRELGIEGLSVTEEGYTVERANDLLRTVAETGDPETVEWRVETADGERLWLEATLARGEIGGQTRVLSMHRDITERRRRRREYEQVFDGVIDAIAVFDPETLAIRDVNEAYLDLVGREDLASVRQAGIEGLSATDSGFTLERAREIHGRVAETGEPELVEWRAETSDGERRWLEIKVAPATIGGEAATIAVHRDVTERKRREQRLEVFNRVLRHNLRNRADVIRSHAVALAEATDDAGHADRVVAEADDLATLGDRARSIDRLLAGDTDPGRVDPGAVARRVVDAVDAGPTTVAVDADDAGSVVTDERALRTALESAVENAVAHADGTVSVRTHDRPEGCAVVVADDGPGIPDDELAALEAGTETDLQHGRGLGLWQLQWSVEVLGGDLSFDTDDGTTVRIRVSDRTLED